MFNELKTKDDAWMQSIHERIDRLSAMIDGIFGDGAVPPKEDVYLCDSEVACMLKVSRRTLGEYRSNGTLPYYVLLVARSCTRGARSSRCWNGNIGVSARRGEADEDSIYLFFTHLYRLRALRLSA